MVSMTSMERRSSNREHHGQHEVSRHRKSEHWLSESAKRSSADPKERSMHLKESLAPALSGDDDYVRRWLARTDNEVEPDVGKTKTRGNKAGKCFITPLTPEKELGLTSFIFFAEHRDAMKKPKLELRSFQRAIDEDDTMQQQQHLRKKRHYRSSSDSSLLEPIPKPKPISRKGEQSKARTDGREEGRLQQQHKKRRFVPSESRSTAASNVRQETFEKRDRHKTREDRYEPKKQHQSEKTDGERKPKRKREKKGDKAKAAKKASEDLMDNFSSKSVCQDRLTVGISSKRGA